MLSMNMNQSHNYDASHQKYMFVNNTANIKDDLHVLKCEYCKVRLSKTKVMGYACVSVHDKLPILLKEKKQSYTLFFQ